MPGRVAVKCSSKLALAYIRSALRACEAAGVVGGLLLRPNRDSKLKVVLSEFRLQQGARLLRKGTSRACVARVEGWKDCGNPWAFQTQSSRAAEGASNTFHLLPLVRLGASAFPHRMQLLSQSGCGSGCGRAAKVTQTDPQTHLHAPQAGEAHKREFEGQLLEYNWVPRAGGGAEGQTVHRGRIYVEFCRR